MNTIKATLALLLAIVLSAAVFADSSDYDQMMNDSLTYLELGETNESLEILRQMKRYFGEDQYINTVYGVILMVGGYGDEAQKILDKQDNEAAALCRAVLFARRGKYEQAINAFSAFEGKIANWQVIMDFLRTMQNAEYVNPELDTASLPAMELAAYWNMLRDKTDDALSLLSNIARVKANDIYKDTKGVVISYTPEKPIFFNAYGINGKIGLDLQVKKADYTLKGQATLKADIANTPGVSSAMLYFDNKMKSMTNDYPFSFDINTESLVNGIHTVKIAVMDQYGSQLTERELTVEIVNQKPHSEPDAQNIMERLTEFITPHQGMETVNYLMAVCAARKKDYGLHREALERCVAVNPLYKDASELLRRYYFISEGSSIIEKGNPSKKQICLSFDDGPNPSTLENLRLLKQYGARATFFMVGRQAEKYPEIIKAIQADGHQLALHSQNHPNYTKLGYIDIVKETLQCYCALKSCGVNPTLYFRPPGGNRDAEQSRLSREYGINIGLWTKNTTHLLSSTPEIVAAYVNESMKPGFIYLLHDHTISNTQALPIILRYAAEHGYKCVTMEDIVK